MRYQVFDKKITRTSNPAVTINPAGRLYLNQAAASYLRANRVKAVLLLWNPDSFQVGISPVTLRDRRGYRVAYSQKGGGAFLTAKGFLDWIDYETDELFTFEAEWNERDDMLEFSIPSSLVGE